jgi:DNA-binding response OmpR family regulator
MSAPRILVIEDEERIAEILARGLGLQGFAVTVALDGRAGKEAWSSGAFDLILLDVMLPEVDGITLCAERRAAGDQTPVILLTARSDEELRDRGLAAGADDYISKPFVYAELIARIRRHLPPHDVVEA